MSWSQLRKHIRSRIVPELSKRVDLHFTVYEGSSHYCDEKDVKNWRLWITLDKQEIFSTDFWEYNKHPALQEKKRAGKFICLSEAEAVGAHNVDHSMSGLKSYLSMPIEEARCHELPIIRALFWLDTRVGKRTLKKYKPDVDEHELVKTFYGLRESLWKMQPSSTEGQT